MAKVCTGTGDAGETSLYSGERISKCSPRMEACGCVDELQAQLGLARALVGDPDVAGILLKAEVLLVDAMAQLADANGAERIDADAVQWVEGVIDEYAPQDFGFQVPGNDVPSAALHVARTVARRAERRILRLHAEEPVGADMLRFFNRLSDMCWVLACSLDPDTQESRS